MISSITIAPGLILWAEPTDSYRPSSSSLRELLFLLGGKSLAVQNSLRTPEWKFSYYLLLISCEKQERKQNFYYVIKWVLAELKHDSVSIHRREKKMLFRFISWHMNCQILYNRTGDWWWMYIKTCELSVMTMLLTMFWSRLAGGQLTWELLLSEVLFFFYIFPFKKNIT